MMGDICDDDEMNVYIGPISSYMPKKLVIDDFFESSSESLNIAHVNCNYILPHIDEMVIRFEGSGVDVIGVYETFLTTLNRCLRRPLRSSGTDSCGMIYRFIVD
jgi:hypothetical protein